VGRKQGVSERQVAELADFETSEAFTDQEKVVLHYAVEMTRTPVDVPDDLFESLRGHFNERQLVELTSAIAWENYRARFNHALGIEAEGFSEGSVCPVPERARISSGTAHQIAH
jgi:4-carboxymuconolactone decarboxylase